MNQPVLLAVGHDEDALGVVEGELRDRYGRHYPGRLRAISGECAFAARRTVAAANPGSGRGHPIHVACPRPEREREGSLSAH